MRLVIDTNVLISALLSGQSLPALLVALWQQRQFELLMLAEQLDEIRRVTRYPKLRVRLRPDLAGRLINEMQHKSLMIDKLPSVILSPDSDDNHLLALAEAGDADFLITGDNRDLLAMERYAGTRILSVRAFLTLQRWLP